MKENAPAYHKAFLDCCDALDMTGCLWDTGGYCILITDLKINGESVKLKGRNYTCADDGHCTRSNLYNEWVDIKGAREGARVLMGDLTGISATLLDTSADIMKEIRTMEITFRYEPRKGK